MYFPDCIRPLDLRYMSRPRFRLSESTAKYSRRDKLMTRPPLDRMQQIFQKLKADKHPSRQSLAGDIEVTTKTIQRDIDFMRDRLNLP